jgi:hypothetical protein
MVGAGKHNRHTSDRQADLTPDNSASSGLRDSDYLRRPRRRLGRGRVSAGARCPHTRQRNRLRPALGALAFRAKRRKAEPRPASTAHEPDRSASSVGPIGAKARDLACDYWLAETHCAGRLKCLRGEGGAITARRGEGKGMVKGLERVPGGHLEL